MESIYASKWVNESLDQQTQKQLENINMLIQRIKLAPVVREENRQSMLQSAKKIQALLVNLSNENDTLSAEIDLAMKLYKIDVPEHKERYFVFSSSGQIVPCSKEEYERITPNTNSSEE